MEKSKRCKPYVSEISNCFFMDKIFKISKTSFSKRRELHDEVKVAINERVVELLEQGIINIEIDDGAQTVLVKRENCEIIWPAYYGDDNE